MDLVTYALVTLDNCKTFLGINDSQKDEVLKYLINQATDYIETYTGRRFTSTVYNNEEMDGTGRNTISLKHFPIISFTSLQRNRANNNTDDWETISSEDYWVDNDTGIITKTSGFADIDDETDSGLTQGSMFECGKNKYRSTYSAGYATIPYDIQYACMSFVSEALNRRKAMGVKQESLGDHSITFESVTQKNDEIKNILNKYKEINI